MRTPILAAVISFALAAGARAEVAEQFAGGFRIAQTVQVQAGPEKLYGLLLNPAAWWSDDHTYSGKAANLSLKAEPGGCFCEVVPSGGVRHAVVVAAISNDTLRLEGGLGPLQAEGGSAALTFGIKPKGTASELTVTYNVGGLSPAAASRWAAPVDQVLSAQVERLKRLAETGKP